jgi:hypothetical protein
MRGVVFQRTVSPKMLTAGVLFKAGPVGLWLQMDGTFTHREDTVGWLQGLAADGRNTGIRRLYAFQTAVDFTLKFLKSFSPQRHSIASCFR